jgi:hypothetical protein
MIERIIILKVVKKINILIFLQKKIKKFSDENEFFRIALMEVSILSCLFLRLERYCVQQEYYCFRK